MQHFLRRQLNAEVLKAACTNEFKSESARFALVWLQKKQDEKKELILVDQDATAHCQAGPQHLSRISRALMSFRLLALSSSRVTL
jgi:hypothetical protein